MKLPKLQKQAMPGVGIKPTIVGSCVQHRSWSPLPAITEDRSEHMTMCTYITRSPENGSVMATSSASPPCCCLVDCGGFPDVLRSFPETRVDNIWLTISIVSKVSRCYMGGDGFD